MRCGICCELAGCVHRPIVDSESPTVGCGQNQTLVSYTLAGLVKLNVLTKTPTSGLSRGRNNGEEGERTEGRLDLLLLDQETRGRHR
jgi:hypothetical protein